MVELVIRSVLGLDDLINHYIKHLYIYIYTLYIYIYGEINERLHNVVYGELSRNSEKCHLITLTFEQL